MRRFAFRLAAMCGEWDVDKMLYDMPAKLFTEWQQFSQLEPFGAMVEELRIGQQCALLANINSDKSNRFTPHDFLTTVHYQKPQQAPEDMLTLLRGFKRGKSN